MRNPRPRFATTRAASAAVGMTLILPACGRPHDRYIVTARPLNLGVVSQPLCIAFDPADAQGVWWWEPGRSGCPTRSTGPDVFRADHASVVTRGGTTDVSFRLGLHVVPDTRPPFAEIALRVDRESMQSVASGARVPIERRATLQMREELPGPR